MKLPRKFAAHVSDSHCILGDLQDIVAVMSQSEYVE